MLPAVLEHPSPAPVTEDSVEGVLRTSAMRSLCPECPLPLPLASKPHSLSLSSGPGEAGTQEWTPGSSGDAEEGREAPKRGGLCPGQLPSVALPPLRRLTRGQSPSSNLTKMERCGHRERKSFVGQAGDSGAPRTRLAFLPGHVPSAGQARGARGCGQARETP